MLSCVLYIGGRSVILCVVCGREECYPVCYVCGGGGVLSCVLCVCVWGVLLSPGPFTFSSWSFIFACMHAVFVSKWERDREEYFGLFLYYNNLN